MEVRRRADVDEINFRVGEEVGEVGVAFDLAQVHFGARRSEIALDAAPVPGQFLGVAAGNRGDARALHPLGGEKMDHAHKTDAGDADVHHFSKSWVQGVRSQEPRTQ